MKFCIARRARRSRRKSDRLARCRPALRRGGGGQMVEGRDRPFRGRGRNRRQACSDPAVDADLYADVADRVTLSFDWNRKKNIFVGTPKFQNYPGKVSNLFGMERIARPANSTARTSISTSSRSSKARPARPPNSSASAFTPKRWSPSPAVRTCACTRAGSARRSVYIGPPDPQMLAMAGMLPPDSPIKVSPDGKSIVMTAQTTIGSGPTRRRRNNRPDSRKRSSVSLQLLFELSSSPPQTQN